MERNHTRRVSLSGIPKVGWTIGYSRQSLLHPEDPANRKADDAELWIEDLLC